MMQTCNAASVWQNNSYTHFGVPTTRTIVPLVRVNGQIQDAPPNWKIPLCQVETPALYQSGSLVASASALTFTKLQELVIPAGTVVGGERFMHGIGLAVPQRGTTADVTLALRITDSAETSVVSTALVVIAVPTSGGARYANASIFMYYDAVTGKMQILIDARSDTIYARSVFPGMNFNPAIIQKIQLGVTLSAIAASQSADVEFLTMGRMN